MRCVIFLSLLFIVPCIYANKGTPYSIKGTVPTTGQHKLVYLYVQSAGKQYPAQLLSTPVVNGQFAFSGQAHEDSLGLAMGVLFFHHKPALTKQEYLALYQQGLKFRHRRVVLEKEVVINVQSTVDQATVQGDLLNEQQNELQRLRQMEIDDYDSLAAWRIKQAPLVKGNVDAQLKLQADYFKRVFANQEKKDNAYFDFVKKYPASPFSYTYLKVFVLMSEKSTDAFREQLQATLAALPAEVKAKPAIQRLTREAALKAAVVSKLAAGTVIPDHAFNIRGEAPVTVQSYRGKYLLLDFWTSWCSPCRAEHYNMKQLYTQYKGRNFEILQVSLDDKEEKWKKALAEDQLPWTQVRCLTGWDKELAEKFDVQGVPTTYLIDPQGRVIARNLRGEALNKKLAEVMP